MGDIVAYARRLVEARCAPHAPIEIHRHLPADELTVLFSDIRREYGCSDEAGRLWRRLFEAVGLPAEAIARDRLVLRFQPHSKQGAAAWSGRSVSTVGFHRDSWATNLYAQVNWWAPIYPITPGRTVAMYPGLWEAPLANTSKDFDMAEAMRRVRENRDVKSRDVVPQLLQVVDPAEAIPVVIEPGGIIAFSAQHAHAGVPNHTDLTRISVETRTVLIDDHVARRGSPNVDGSAYWMAPGLFRRVSDGRALSDLLGTRVLEPFDGHRHAC
jgi:hypothetical protein